MSVENGWSRAVLLAQIQNGAHERTGKAASDRIQVDSPGLLLPGMTVESMRRASRLRNPSLARIFREARIMEQWGTGVERVYDQIAAAGLPEPTSKR